MQVQLVQEDPLRGNTTPSNDWYALPGNPVERGTWQATAYDCRKELDMDLARARCWKLVDPDSVFILWSAKQ